MKSDVEMNMVRAMPISIVARVRNLASQELKTYKAMEEICRGR